LRLLPAAYLYTYLYLTTMAAITGETLQERSKGKDVRLSNIVAAKVCRH
jgi:hypothetical protein